MYIFHLTMCDSNFRRMDENALPKVLVINALLDGSLSPAPSSNILYHFQKEGGNEKVGSPPLFSFAWEKGWTRLQQSCNNNPFYYVACKKRVAVYSALAVTLAGPLSLNRRGNRRLIIVKIANTSQNDNLGKRPFCRDESHGKASECIHLLMLKMLDFILLNNLHL
ncbi:hypothetical protein BDF20DRAFT_991114 [Mycotypha africana]|uniref:uncharacterized protein n=1 Tax=Mycotypha africana TaxID=64632 RepID=UPI0023004D0F|nr:uncharacterized protein BDF20DRAFT_991114 [Mycotypha africana]KAI8969330.1 hypothetical protein BDF20DRAFT_991114 [Mycotypha africana]